MRFSRVYKDGLTNRLCRLVLLLALALCATAVAAGPAAANSTWTGGGGATTNWSDASNWSPAAVPGAGGTLTFPELSATACPTAATSCFSANDIPGLSVTRLDIDAADSYAITGDGITLTGGLTTLRGSDQGAEATLGVPITLGAANAWVLDAPSTGLPDYLDLSAPLAGDYPLTVDIANHNALALNGDNEVGAVNVTGTGAGSCAADVNNGGVDIRDGNGLNSTDGDPITLTDTGLQVEGTSVGPLSSVASCLKLTMPSTAPFTVPSATFDSASAIDFSVQDTPTTVGTDFTQLSSGGTVALGGASLNISNVPGSASCTSPPGAGTMYTFVSAGTLTGTFGNAPNGGTIEDDCAGSSDEYVINYNTATSPETVTATVIAAPRTTLSATPSSPVTNQAVGLTATITLNGDPVQTGTVDFEAGGVTIPGCGAEPVSTAGPYVATCQTSFAAASSPVALSAAFTQTGSDEAAPAGTYSLRVGKDSTSTAVALYTPTVVIGKSATYTATVKPAHSGPTEPSGTVEFFDGRKKITSCPTRPLYARASASTATCTLSYPFVGSHPITAKYGGDGSFTGSASSPAQPEAVVESIGRPTLSATSIRGLAKRAPKLAFTVSDGKNEPALSAIAISPPRGIIFAARKRIVVKGANGKRLKFTAKVSKGRLTITLEKAASKVSVTIASPSISVSKRLAARVKAKKAKSTTFTVRVTDIGHMRTKLRLKLAST